MGGRFGRSLATAAALALLGLSLQGCLAVGVGMAAGTVVGTAAKVGVGATKMAVNTTTGTVRTVGRAVTPGGGDKRKRRREAERDGYERYRERR